MAENLHDAPLPVLPTLEQVCADAKAHDGKKARRAVWIKRIDDLETPVSALAKLGPDRAGSCLFESVEGGETRGRYSIVCCDPDLVFQIDQDGAKTAHMDENGMLGPWALSPHKPLEALRALIAENQFPFPDSLPPPAAGLYGYLAYEFVGEVEELVSNGPDPLGCPIGKFYRPQVVIVFDGIKQELLLVTTIEIGDGAKTAQEWHKAQERLKRIWTILDQPVHLARPQPFDAHKNVVPDKANMAPEAYMAGVEKAKNYIRAGDIFQVVPSQRFSAPMDASPLAFYRALRRTNPSPFLFHLNMDNFSIVGSSPEILVRLRDGKVTIRPIAGTRPRGASPALDAALEEELLADPKERAEHLMLLDLGRNDVGRVAQSRTNPNDPNGGGGVKVTQRFIVERYSHVMHIVSNVEGQIKPELDALDALMAGFPAGTVSGAPKVRAMEIISELEPHARGIYGGGVGYFSSNGDMDLAIALRTGILKNGRLHAQAGAGVVLDSNPLAEQKECEAKARALFHAAGEAHFYDAPKGSQP